MIKGARRVKDLIRNKAKGDSSRSQALLRHYAMERFLERLANSHTETTSCSRAAC